MKKILLLLTVLMLLPLCAQAVTTVPENVAIVEDEAFAGTGVDALIIPASVQTVGANVLAGSNASYLYLKGASTTLAASANKDVPFIFAPAASAASSLSGFYATENLVLDSGLYYAVTDNALPLCAQAPFSLTGSVTIPKVLGGVPITSLEALYLSNTRASEVKVPQYLTIPSGTNYTPYQTLFVTTPTASVTSSPAGQYITWTTTIEGAYGAVSYLWTFTVNGETVTTVTAEPTVQYAPPTQGSCTASVTAQDALGDKAASADSAAVTITEALPTYRALLVGNTYLDEENALPGCDNDVAAMTAMLNSMSGTKYKITPVLNITAGEIRSRIASAFAGAQPGDVSLFYYSGHGTSSGSLVGIGSTALTVYSLRTALDEIPGTKIVILDCCHSGTVINRSTSSVSAFNSAVISAFASKSRSSENLEDEGYIVLTACRKDQESQTVMDGLGAAFGAFTYGICYGSGYDEWNERSLGSMPADADGNGAITLGEAYSGVGERIAYLNTMMTEDSQLTQAMQYHGSTSFVLWRK